MNSEIQERMKNFGNLLKKIKIKWGILKKKFSSENMVEQHLRIKFKITMRNTYETTIYVTKIHNNESVLT